MAPGRSSLLQVRVRDRLWEASSSLPDLWIERLDPAAVLEGSMNIWVFPIAPPWPLPKCEVCGRPIATGSGFGRIERICRACLDTKSEKRAA